MLLFIAVDGIPPTPWSPLRPPPPLLPPPPPPVRLTPWGSLSDEFGTHMTPGSRSTGSSHTLSSPLSPGYTRQGMCGLYWESCDAGEWISITIMSARSPHRLCSASAGDGAVYDAVCTHSTWEWRILVHGVNLTVPCGTVPSFCKTALMSADGGFTGRHDLVL